ncbi:MAG TPA: nitroreductase family protein [Acidobacteriota bacterium]|nr:nitroreductase family protein [Acidobacteriota bacterium]
MTNPILESLLNRKSIRKYTDQVPTDEVVQTLARAAQQAPFATQSCSLLLTRRREKHPFRAPLFFTICADHHRLGLIMAKRNWRIVTNDAMLFFYGLQDACLMAENLVVAAESLGMGSCFIGQDEASIKRLRKQYKLPPRVLPVVQLTVGYPAEDPPPRPRYPLDFFLFEDVYPEFTDEQIERAMAVMDDGYMGQDYYRKARLILPLEGGREETFTHDTYGWTEHISRKWGQWHASPAALLQQFAECGFDIARDRSAT